MANIAYMVTVTLADGSVRGYEVNGNSARSLAAVFRKAGMPFTVHRIERAA